MAKYLGKRFAKHSNVDRAKLGIVIIELDLCISLSKSKHSVKLVMTCMDYDKQYYKKSITI